MAQILIVDDSPIMRRNLRKIITDAGHTVIAEAQNGQEAYDQYVKFMPDLTTMDITMPVINGIDALKNILNDYPGARIIMISGLEQKQMVYQAIESGAKHYIIKPVTIDKVVSVINEALDPEDYD